MSLTTFIELFPGTATQTLVMPIDTTINSRRIYSISFGSIANPSGVSLLVSNVMLDSGAAVTVVLGRTVWNITTANVGRYSYVPLPRKGLRCSAANLTTFILTEQGAVTLTAMIDYEKV